MYSLIFLIIFKIFNIISDISTDINIQSLTEVVWYTLNFSLAVYFIYMSFITSFNNSSSIRILKYSKENDSYFIKILIFLTLLSPVVPGIITLYFRYLNESLTTTFPEKILISLDILNVIFLLSFLFIKNKDRFDIFKQTKKNEHKGLSLTAFVVSIIVIFASLYSLLKITELKEIDKLNLFIITFLCFAILIIFEKIIERFKYDIFARDLENLEYEIFVKDLSDKEVRIILQKNYMGFLINDYLELKQEELSQKQESFQEQENLIANKLKELKEIDKEKYSIEYRGRQEDIISLKQTLNLEQIDFYRDQQAELKEIIKKDPNLSNDALNKIDDIVDGIYIKLKKLKS